MAILAIRAAARMAVIYCSRTCTPGRGGEGTCLTAHPVGFIDSDNLQAINTVNPNFADQMFIHYFKVLNLPRKIFFMKALKPKQNVAMLAPTSTNSKFVRWSIYIAACFYPVGFGFSECF